MPSIDLDHAVTLAAAIVLASTMILLPVLVWQQRIARIQADSQFEDLRHAMNGRFDKLLHAYGRAQRAEGVEQERTEERARKELDRLGTDERAAYMARTEVERQEDRAEAQEDRAAHAEAGRSTPASS